ncbi:hypothetical protein ACFFLM_11125 [Deinococcus oregonensis]|uniref:Uncharacterized protein n=1 Tax=Deinococcus oregonensis TaxID=1805970 RepID=A0ABV6AYD6_9DEIO
MTLLDFPPDLLASEQSIKIQVTGKIHALADQADWCHLNITQKTRLYESWILDPTLGGRLAALMGTEKVHRYIKDTVMRAYMRTKRPDLPTMLKRMSFRHTHLVQSYEKPHALLYDHTHLYTLTVAKEWRMALLSAYERATFVGGHLDRNLVLITDHGFDRFLDQGYRGMVESAGKRLDVDVHWVR